MTVRIRMQICGFVFTIFAPGFLVVYTFLPQGNLIYSKSNFVQCVYHLTMNGRSKTLVLVLSLTKFMWPPLIDWNDYLFAGFWCGTLEEFVGPNWDEITLNDALQAYAISDIWWEFVTWKSVCGELNSSGECLQPRGLWLLSWCVVSNLVISKVKNCEAVLVFAISCSCFLDEKLAVLFTWSLWGWTTSR